MHYGGEKGFLYNQQLWGQSLSNRFPALHRVLCLAIRFLEVELLCRLKGALRTSLVLGAAAFALLGRCSGILWWALCSPVPQ